MGKKSEIDQLTNLMSRALRHKIGSIVNKDDFYAEKYAKDSNNIMKEAEKVLIRWNWNREDKIKIKEKLKRKLFSELKEKDFIDDEKYNLMDKEINRALEKFELLD